MKDSGAARLEARGDGVYALCGSIDFRNARALHASGVLLLAAHQAPQALVIDCAGVTHANSAALAVLIDWLACARRRGRSLQYASLPEHLRAVARMSEVEDLIEPA